MKPNSFAPETLRALLIEILSDRKSPAYTPVATLDEQGHPQVRTVHLRYLAEIDGFGFNTHTHSAKARHIDQNSLLAGVYYDAKRGVQLRWEGKASRVDADKNAALIERLWGITRRDVQDAYGENAEQKNGLADRCPNFITIQCHPERWDFGEIDSANYRNDRRTIYTFVGKEWRATRVSTLDGRPLIKV